MSKDKPNSNNTRLFNTVSGFTAKCFGAGIVVGGAHYGLTGAEDVVPSLRFAAAGTFGALAYDVIDHVTGSRNRLGDAEPSNDDGPQ